MDLRLALGNVMASEAWPSQYVTKRLSRTLWVLIVTLEYA